MLDSLLTEMEQKAIEELKIILDKQLDSYWILLFGSKARGISEEFSDIDLLIIANQEVDSKLRRDILDRAYQIELKYNVLFQLVIRSDTMWKKMQEMTFGKNVQKHGIQL